MVGFEPFLVNVAGSGSNRFLRLSLRLLVNGPAQAARLDLDEVAKTRVRSAILELLAAQRAEALITPDGKATLKREIAEQSAGVVDGIEVLDVLFTEFVVQY
jgi:flagellar basal body-associated protein FliL